MVSDFVLWPFWCVNVSVSLSLYVSCAFFSGSFVGGGWFSSGLLFILLSLDAYLYSNEEKKGCEFGLEELKKETVITYCMKKVYFQ